MTDAANTLLQQALSLSPEDRIEVAEQLYQSLGDEFLPDDSEFDAELNRRVKEVEKHPERLLDGPQVMAELQARLRERNRS